MKGGGNELFKQNKKLVYYVYHKLIKELPQDFISQHGDDLKQEGLIGLWKASERFDESRGNKFTSYAVSLIRGYMLIYIETVYRSKRKGEKLQFVSLDAEYFKDVTFHAAIPTKGEEDELWILTDNRLTEEERKLVRLIYEGYTQKEIAGLLGIKQPTVSRRILLIKEKLIEE